MIDIFEKHAELNPNNPLISDGSVFLTYAAFADNARMVAESLIYNRVEPGDKVALFTSNNSEFFVSLFGIWYAGAVAVPLNTRLPAATLERVTSRARPSALLGSPLPFASSPKRVAVADGNDCGQPSGLSRTSEHTAIIMFTSGSTGAPKGVAQSMAAITANAKLTAAALELNDKDRIFVNTPPCFTSSICHFLTLLVKGGSYFGAEGFHFGDDTLRLMTEHDCSGFGGAPAHLRRVVEPLSAPVETIRARFWVSSGDHLPAPMIEKFHNVLPGVELFYMYGLTEVSGRLCVVNTAKRLDKLGSVGKPIGDMQISIRRDDGTVATAGEGGEIHVNGPLLADGYYELPDETQKAFTKRGFRTRDFGRIDADGYVWVEGRLDDILKIGGEKVSTIAVQLAIAELHGVKDAAVLAVDDAAIGKALIAYIVQDGTIALTKVSALRALRESLPTNAVPKQIHFVDLIPLTGSGKVDRNALSLNGI